jgi:hypothetical protein
MTVEIERINFPRPQYDALGRNGYYGTTGLSVMMLDNQIIISPITTRNKIAQTRIVIPVDYANELATCLIDLASRR